MLAWLELKHRYRRSLLGPLWVTLSTAAFILGMGSLYDVLFGQMRAHYIHYVGIGLVIWLFIAGLINDGCQTFISAEGFLKQTRLPVSVHAQLVVCRNFLVFLHNFVIVLALSAYFRPTWHWTVITVLPGIFLIAMNGFAWALLLGLLSARFRDIPQTVASLVQLMFFVTPIFWRPEMLAGQQWVVKFNPAFHLIELVRSPLLGEPVPAESWLVALATTVGCWTLAVMVLAHLRARVAYWV